MSAADDYIMKGDCNTWTPHCWVGMLHDSNATSTHADVSDVRLQMRAKFASLAIPACDSAATNETISFQHPTSVDTFKHRYSR